MENNFDLKKFLIENKLTRLSEQDNEWNLKADEEWNIKDLVVGSEITEDMLKKPIFQKWEDVQFPIKILGFDKDEEDNDIVYLKITRKKKNIFGKDKLVTSTIEDYVNNWNAIDLKPGFVMLPS